MTAVRTLKKNFSKKESERLAKIEADEKLELFQKRLCKAFLFLGVASVIGWLVTGNVFLLTLCPFFLAQAFLCGL